MKAKDFSNKILTGMSIGIVAALVPSAILGELSKALGFTSIVLITGMAARFAALAMGLCIAAQFKMKPIHSVALAISTMIGSGAIKIIEGSMVLAGLGDIINAGLTAAIAALLLLWFGDRLKSYTMILVPTLTIAISGLIGLFTLPYVSMITGGVGQFIAWCTTLQPILMGALISMSFAIIIISPISTVGIALAISLSGIGAGAANLGICAAAFGLGIAGFEKNGWGNSLAPILGSPKLHMANFLENPKMTLPLICSAGVLGILAGMLGIVGTPMSAGFGISGLIGPLNHLGIVGFTAGNWIITILMFVVLPIILGFVFKYVFFKGFKILSADDYAIEI
jgi:uncharacterized membrane protein